MDHKLPISQPDVGRPPLSERKRRWSRYVWTAIFAYAVVHLVGSALVLDKESSLRVPLHAEENLAKCRALDVFPGPPKDFHSRRSSDRFVPGTKAVLIKNATIWTGGDTGHEVVLGDILLEDGLIKDVGADINLKGYKDLVVHNVGGAWVTPG
jgi:hypothetical protein